ncbi:MAG: CRTAC1 family protein, partial [Candidatus Cloacimonetes bacterium]|nr:CRTAC1 family protein [Candidatus Cloacimonadota bacterium]
SQLFRNEEGLRFADVTDSVGLTDHYASGGVWADFNQDGYLDFASTSYDGDGRGDSLMKNHQNQRFMRVNERAGDIADDIPSLSAAWIDIDGKGFPSLYVEKHTEQGGYYNRFWHNSAGYFAEGDPELSAKAAEIIIQQHFANPNNWDELKESRMYSAPLWADFDNDGLMDLFVTSPYENERRHLFRNNGDGSFTDVSFLSGVWKYGSWGYSCGDLNRDGLLDLVVGGRIGTKILYNVTNTPNKSLFIKPVWQDGEIMLLDDPALYPQHPNSPAFGTRVAVTLTMPDGSQNTLVRELNSTFGNFSQNALELHFGLGQATSWNVERVNNEED